MRKTISLFIFSLFLVGCSSKIDETQWQSVEDDLSIETIEESLGKPNNTITDKREMLDEVNRKINAAKDLINSPVPFGDDVLAPINQSIEDLETVHYGIENDGDMKILQYEVSGEREDGENYTSTRNIYFYGDRVIYYDGARSE